MILDDSLKPLLVAFSFPEGQGTALGSKLGRTVWESAEARKLVEALMEDESFRAWFEPPPGLAFTEPRLRLASVAHFWSSSAAPADLWVADQIRAIKDSLWDESPVGNSLCICQGVTVRTEIRLPYGFVVAAPADREHLELFQNNFPISQAEILRLPDSPTMYLLASSRASRQDFGGLAAMSAYGFAMIGTYHLREHVWLASGVLPSGGDCFLWHASAFPPGLPDRIHTSLTLRLRTVPVGAPSVELDPNILHEITVRDWALRTSSDSATEDETWLALWMARTFIHAALDAPEPLICFLMSYATLDGLFRLDGDDESRLGPRIAMLIGDSNAERRAIRQFFRHAHDLRGKAAHGNRPHGTLLGQTLGRDVPAVLTQGTWEQLRNELYQDLEIRCLSLLRRSLLAFYALTTRVVRIGSEHELPGVTRLLSRTQVLALLEAAASNNQFAKGVLSVGVPAYAKLDFPTPLTNPPSAPPGPVS